MSLLEKPECLGNVISLTINTETMSWPTLNLSYVAHINKVHLLVRTLSFRIVCPENITHLYCYSSIDGFALQTEVFKRLELFVAMSIPVDSVKFDQCPLFMFLLYNVPKTCQVQLFAEKNTHLVPVCKHLIKKKVNVRLVHWNDSSYINSQLIQHFVAGVQCVKFDHVFWSLYSSYQVPDHLKDVQHVNDFFQFMDQEQQFYWWFLVQGN